MYVENIVVGGGPAGVQQAYFLKYHNLDYVLLERSDSVASFFRRYPVQRRLISVNKVNCGKNDPLTNMENILRYDWNSLLLMPQHYGRILFRDFSEAYYPPADKLVEYLERFVQIFNLNIAYNTGVEKIEKQEGGEEGFRVLCVGGKTYTCKRLFVCSGLQLRRLPNVHPSYERKLRYYDNLPPVADYKNKNVLIVGGGNAGFEVANAMNEHANEITVMGAERFGWNTHYPGNIRSVNMTILDSYYLKVKVNLDWSNEPKMRYDGKYQEFLHAIAMPNSPYLGHYQLIVVCNGYQPNLCFLEGVPVDREDNGFPKLTPFYESTSCPGLFFIGALSQGQDWKHGTSAFIHGFRYNIRCVTQYITDTFSKAVYSRVNEVVDRALTQLNRSSCLLHRFDFFGDAVWVYPDRYEYVAHLPLAAPAPADAVYSVRLWLGYDDRNAFEPRFRQPQTGNPYTRDISVFIHPIIRIVDASGECMSELHLPENAFNRFVGYKQHYTLLYGFLRILDTHKGEQDKEKMCAALQSYQAMISFEFDRAKNNQETDAIPMYLE